MGGKNIKALEYCREVYLKAFSEVPENQRNAIVDLYIKELYEVIWDLNKDRIIDECNTTLEEEKQKVKIGYDSKLQESSNKLEEELDKKCSKCSFNRLKTALLQGIVLGFIVGIGVNQITELIGKTKNSIENYAKVPNWGTTLIIVFILFAILAFVIFYYVLDEYKDFKDDNR